MNWRDVEFKIAFLFRPLRQRERTWIADAKLSGLWCQQYNFNTAAFRVRVNQGV